MIFLKIKYLKKISKYYLNFTGDMENLTPTPQLVFCWNFSKIFKTCFLKISPKIRKI